MRELKPFLCGETATCPPAGVNMAVLPDILAHLMLSWAVRGKNSGCAGNRATDGSLNSRLHRRRVRSVTYYVALAN